jgi:nicotinate-nucleotide adenylyltransferase
MTELTSSTPPQPSRKLCFGGSFNPIHIGHLLVARAVAEEKKFAGVVLIPSAMPPHKQQTAEMAAATDRLEMCRRVAEDDPLFEVDDIELRRAGPSFTLETARELKRRGWPEVHWLIGADMLQFLPNWHEPMQLLREVGLWVVKRPGFDVDWSSMPSEFGALRSQVVTGPLVQMSASEIRDRVRRGLSIRYMVPPVVERYIAEHDLYGLGCSSGAT